MFIKILLVLLVLFMIFNLFRAMTIMVRGDTDQRMSKFIGRRVWTSAVIVILIIVAMATGLIEPNPRPY